MFILIEKIWLCIGIIMVPAQVYVTITGRKARDIHVLRSRASSRRSASSTQRLQHHLASGGVTVRHDREYIQEIKQIQCMWNIIEKVMLVIAVHIFEVKVRLSHVVECSKSFCCFRIVSFHRRAERKPSSQNMFGLSFVSLSVCLGNERKCEWVYSGWASPAFYVQRN